MITNYQGSHSQNANLFLVTFQCDPRYLSYGTIHANKIWICCFIKSPFPGILLGNYIVLLQG